MPSHEVVVGFTEKNKGIRKTDCMWITEIISYSQSYKLRTPGISDPKDLGFVMAPLYMVSISS